MRLLFLLAGLMVLGYTNAQKDDTPLSHIDYKSPGRSYFQKGKLEGGTSAEHALRYLVQNINTLQGGATGLKLNYVTESLTGYHYSFTQTFKGVDIYQSEVKLNCTYNGVVYAVFDNSVDTRDWNIYVNQVTENSVIAYDRDADEFVLAERSMQDRYFEVLTSKGRKVYQRDTRSYAAPDSMVSGKIFNPDPLTTAGQVYGGAYVDNNDQNAAWFDAQQQNVTFKVTFNGSQFFLRSQYLWIMDVNTPAIAPTVSVTPTFNFNRSQTGFEDVNAFYHLSKYADYVRSLGYKYYPLVDRMLHVDPHGADSNDQSYFVSTATPYPQIEYGQGGVDDAEDADVLVHEFGHFLSYNAAPNTNSGTQRESLDEGMGDYLAASYSKALSPFRSDEVFNWDGHNTFWNGRTLTTNKIYPNDAQSNIYRNGEMWSSALIKIHDDLGRRTTDTLLFETHFNYTQNMKMDEAARLMIMVDSIIFNGSHYCTIYKRMLERGFVEFYANNPCGITLDVVDESIATLKFLQSNNDFTILNPGSSPLKITLVDLMGRTVAPVADINQEQYRYSNANLPSGIYLVAVQTNNSTKTWKWHKAE